MMFLLDLLTSESDDTRQFVANFPQFASKLTSSAHVLPPAQRDGQPAQRSAVKRWFRRALAQREAAVFLMLFLVASYLSFSSSYFLEPRNLLNIGRQFSVVGIVAIGEALVIISGAIDLSVDSTIGLAAVSAAMAALDPEMEVSKLGIADQQMIEIAKAVSRNARLFLMDECKGLDHGHCEYF